MISKEKAFPMFEALLDAGYRPRLSGMRVTQENKPRHKDLWEVGTEGYFLSVGVDTEPAGLTSARMAFFDGLAVEHELTAWFTTWDYEHHDSDGASSFAVVKFE